MKIAYLARARIPSRLANSIHVMKMCRALAENGHEVELISPALSGTEPGVQDLYAYYGVPNSFAIRWLPRWDIKGGDLLYSLQAARRCQRTGVELAYGRHIEGCWAAASAGVPVVFEFHSSTLQFSWSRQRLFADLVRRRQLKRLVVISEALKQHVLDVHHLPPERILVAHDAADILPRFGPLPLGGEEALQVGYAGNLYPGRGMEVIRRLGEHCSFARFHVVGGRGEDLAYWRGQPDIPDNLVFHGFVEPGHVPQFLQSMDVLLAPYQPEVRTLEGQDTGQWMSPLKVFEYMASCRPMVISDLPVLRELVNESNAIIVPPDDVGQWRKALLRLQDPALRERLATRAHNDFLTRYTWAQRARAVVADL